jgi:hypothetical protein
MKRSLDIDNKDIKISKKLKSSTLFKDVKFGDFKIQCGNNISIVSKATMYHKSKFIKTILDMDPSLDKCDIKLFDFYTVGIVLSMISLDIKPTLDDSDIKFMNYTFNFNDITNIIKCCDYFDLNDHYKCCWQNIVKKYIDPKNDRHSDETFAILFSQSLQMGIDDFIVSKTSYHGYLNVTSRYLFLNNASKEWIQTYINPNQISTFHPNDSLTLYKRFDHEYKLKIYFSIAKKCNDSSIRQISATNKNKLL